MSTSPVARSNPGSTAVVGSKGAEAQTSSPIDLLIILDPSEAQNPDGSEAKLKEITVMMDKKWKIHLISGRPIQYKNLTCDYEVHPIGSWISSNSLFSRLLYLLLAVFKGAAIVKQHHIQVVMSKDGHLHLGSVALSIKQLTKRKCIVRVNEDDVLALLLFLKRTNTPLLTDPAFLRAIEKMARRFENTILKRADHIITHGPTDFERISKITNRIDFVPLWVDTQKFKPAEKDQRNKARNELLKLENNKEKVLLFVGRLHPEKDLETLLLGFKKLSDTRKDVTLVIVGDGPDEARCKNLAQTLGISSAVRFIGYIARDNMPKYYNSADIYILTSLWEELSNTIMEAMASGIPVIATAVGGNPYLVKDGRTGYLVPPRNPQALAQKIAYSLNHAEETEKMAANALANISKFQKQPIGTRYKEIIIKLASQSRVD